MNRSWYLLPMILLVYACSRGEGPEQAFLDARAAIDSRNRLAFEAAVDVNTICEQCVDAMLDQFASTRLEDSGAGVEAFGSLLGIQLVGAYKPSLVSRCVSDVAKAIEEGHQLPLPSNETLSFSLGEFTEHEDSALRKVMLATPKDTIRFDLRLERQDRWRIVGLEGLGAAIGEVSRSLAADQLKPGDLEPESGDASPVDDFDTPPEPLRQVPADYPETARLAEYEGIVHVLVTIDQEGSVVGARVQSSDASALLQQAATEAAWQWKFRPATKSGKPVKVRIVIPFRFRLS